MLMLITEITMPDFNEMSHLEIMDWVAEQSTAQLVALMRNTELRSAHPIVVASVLTEAMARLLERSLLP